MLGKYEKRHFNKCEKVWIGTYRNLTNILHWHLEYELIRIIRGKAQIKIGNNLFYAKENEYFLCEAEELHYIIGEKDSLIDIVIFHRDLINEITDKYKLISPMLLNHTSINTWIKKMRDVISQKPQFYNETLDNIAKGLLLDIFNSNALCARQNKKLSGKKTIDKINQDFATITFNEIVAFSGYSPSHFSKNFKKLTGMTFSDYLNYVKIEHAVSLLQSSLNLSITDICSMCGFSTIRNFNRVFKQITGFAPRDLPNNFVTDLNIGVYGKESFNPTSETSILLV